MGEPFLTEARFVRQTGGMCMFAAVVLAWHPSETFLLESPLPEETLPAFVTPALAEGVRSVVGDKTVRVLALDALWHLVDSSPRSFQIAGKMAAETALPKLATLSGPTEQRPAAELLREWGARQQKYLTELSQVLSSNLKGFQPYQDLNVWWRSFPEHKTEQLVRIKCNTPNVPSSFDLQLSVSCPPLLDFLEVPSWRETPEAVPQELGRTQLRTLAGTDRWKLDNEGWNGLLEAWENLGEPLLAQYARVESLLSIGSYMDKGTRAALHLLAGKRETARILAIDGLESSLGHPRQKLFCEKVLQALDS